VVHVNRSKWPTTNKLFIVHCKGGGYFTELKHNFRILHSIVVKDKKSLSSSIEG